MSGGRWQYTQSRMREVVDDLRNIVKQNKDGDSENRGRFGRLDYGFDEDVINRLRATADLLDVATNLTHDADYLLEYDTSDYTFVRTFDRFVRDFKDVNGVDLEPLAKRRD